MFQEVKFHFFSGPCPLQYKAEHLGWSNSLLLQTDAALISDYDREQIDSRYILYMTPPQKTRTVPLRHKALEVQPEATVWGDVSVHLPLYSYCKAQSDTKICELVFGTFLDVLSSVPTPMMSVYDELPVQVQSSKLIRLGSDFAMNCCELIILAHR